jgi:hypothetical protein
MTRCAYKRVYNVRQVWGSKLFAARRDLDRGGQLEGAAEDPALWNFVTSLPADYIAPYEEHIEEFSKTVRPVHTTQQIVFNYILGRMMKPEFRLRNGQHIFTGLVAA